MVVYNPNPRSSNQVKEFYQIASYFPVHLERTVSKAAVDRMIERVQQRLPRRFPINSESKKLIHMMTSALVLKVVMHLAKHGDPSSAVIEREEVAHLFDVLLGARRVAAAA